MTTSSQPFSIVASDLDGTLLSPNHQLSDFAKATLKRLHQKGFTFVFATGRHHVDVAGIREMTGIPAYMVTSNGARVHSPDNTLLYSHNVPAELVQEVIDFVKHDPALFIHIYRNDEWMLNREDEALRAYHNDSGFTYTKFATNHAPTDGVSKLFFTHEMKSHDSLVEHEKRLNEHFGNQLTVAFSTPWCLEVMGPGVSKGHALKIVAESLNQTLDNTIAFGDGMNDIEMLTMAHKGLVMSTAHEKVLNTIPTIERIGSCANDAVAHYLENHLLR